MAPAPDVVAESVVLAPQAVRVAKAATAATMAADRRPGILNMKSPSLFGSTFAKMQKESMPPG
ncbi:hypothetical protein Acy02nite_09390 [Actinoplanes cyaneus]|uniref:Uncharacterized protein n=1 Tax=Actinoplanes cyaneus TaxID=52696 RepID=A0A919IGJ0_9ACTN|nr:hypothetical protein Acy02nite_09390 [Actinoplanes cyaneus]